MDFCKGFQNEMTEIGSRRRLRPRFADAQACALTASQVSPSTDTLILSFIVFMARGVLFEAHIPWRTKFYAGKSGNCCMPASVSTALHVQYSQSWLPWRITATLTSRMKQREHHAGLRRCDASQAAASQSPKSPWPTTWMGGAGLFDCRTLHVQCPDCRRLEV